MAGTVQRAIKHSFSYLLLLLLLLLGLMVRALFVGNTGTMYLVTV
mgnify:CR=1 FL=1